MVNEETDVLPSKFLGRRSIKKALKAKHGSIYKASKALGLSRCQIYHVISGHSDGSRKSTAVALVCADLGIDPSVLLRKKR